MLRLHETVELPSMRAAIYLVCLVAEMQPLPREQSTPRHLEYEGTVQTPTHNNDWHAAGRRPDCRSCASIEDHDQHNELSTPYIQYLGLCTALWLGLIGFWHVAASPLQQFPSFACMQFLCSSLYTMLCFLASRPVSSIGAGYVVQHTYV
jgi:hypothetical protein